MIFKVNEAVGGLKHAGLRWQRIILRRPPTSVLPRFLPALRTSGLLASEAINACGQLRTCSVCGYALVRIKLEEGWTMDVCSAMPILRFNHPQLARWLKDMPPAKLPEVQAKQYTSVADSISQLDR